MGYNTNYSGGFSLTPAASPTLIEYVRKFSEMRHVERDPIILKKVAKKRDTFFGLIGEHGEFYVGQDKTSIIDDNREPERLPALWCNWLISEDGERLEWDGGEKSYCAEDWIKFLISEILVPSGITVNGEVDFQGEDVGDHGKIIVKKNKVSVKHD